LVYFLTEKGRERFPTNYLRLTTRLLDQLKETLPPQMVARLFTQMATDMAGNFPQQAENLTVEQRLDLVKELLAQEGFTIEWEKQGDSYQINEISCPYYHIGQSHPEVCSVDQTLISTILDIPVEKINCVLRGDAHCTYIIPNKAITERQV
jgi:predicted ArsR family transcriptional regulator